MKFFKVYEVQDSVVTTDKINNEPVLRGVFCTPFFNKQLIETIERKGNSAHFVLGELTVEDYYDYKKNYIKLTDCMLKYKAALEAIEQKVYDIWNSAERT